METSDIFATKGAEYILVIGYLVLLAWFWRLIGRRGLVASALSPPRSARALCELPEELFHHPGHTWVKPEGAGVVRVGMNEFALRLVGSSSLVTLPPVGESLRPGVPGWAFEAGEETIPVLAPVRGEVVEVNDAVRRSPELLHAGPYEEGWLLKVKVDDARVTAKNLLSGRSARAWMEETLKGLSPPESGERGLGALMADGGVLVDGFARALDPDGWAEAARELLLTSDAVVPEERKEASSA